MKGLSIYRAKLKNYSKMIFTGYMRFYYRLLSLFRIHLRNISEFRYRINHDVQNIIEFMLFYDRMKNTNKEYKRVFYFFETIWDCYTCPNPSGRCVAKYMDVKIHWMNDRWHRNPNEGPAVEYTNGTKCWYYEGKLHRLEGPAIE